MMYVCICNAVTDKDIKCAVKQGHDTYEKICCQLNVASCCGRCQWVAREVINEARGEANGAKPDTTLIMAFA